MICRFRPCTEGVVCLLNAVKLTAGGAAAMAEEILVPLDRAEGKIAAAAVGLYPPGIPLLAPGERVTREIIRQLQEAGTRERFGVEGEYLRCANV